MVADLRQLVAAFPVLQPACEAARGILDLGEVFAESACPPGTQRLGLKRLVPALLGAPLSKEQCMTNWERRPLTQAQVDYAVLDAAVAVPLLARMSWGQLEASRGGIVSQSLNLAGPHWGEVQGVAGDYLGWWGAGSPAGAEAFRALQAGAAALGGPQVGFFPFEHLVHGFTAWGHHGAAGGGAGGAGGEMWSGVPSF